MINSKEKSINEKLEEKYNAYLNNSLQLINKIKNISISLTQDNIIDLKLNEQYNYEVKKELNRYLILEEKNKSNSLTENEKKEYEQKIYMKDNRNIEILLSMVVVNGWLMEDYIIKKIKQENEDLKLGGTDKERKFSKKPTNEPDFRLNGYGVEFQVTYISNKIKVKKKKLENLIKNNHSLLVFDMANGWFNFISEEELIKILDNNYLEVLHSFEKNNKIINKMGFSLDLNKYDILEYSKVTKKIKNISLHSLMDRYNYI